MFMNITFSILLTLTSRVTILELRVFIPLSDPLTSYEFDNIGKETLLQTEEEKELWSTLDAMVL